MDKNQIEELKAMPTEPVIIPIYTDVSTAPLVVAYTAALTTVFAIAELAE